MLFQERWNILTSLQEKAILLPPHQDGYYFNLDSDKAVTGWLALEDVDDENGCIHYVKGSHKKEEYRPHGKSEILGFSQGVTRFWYRKKIKKIQ